MTTWYVSPTGSVSGDGSIDSPYDIDTMIGASSPAAGGDTIYLLGGRYTPLSAGVIAGASITNGKAIAGKGVYTLRINGASGNNITLRNYPGEAVRINGAIHLVAGQASYVTVRGLEIAATPTTRTFTAATDVDYPGIYITAPGCALVNNYIHDITQIYLFATGGCTVHGNLIGWTGAEYGGAGVLNGGCFYTHNHNGGDMLFKKNAFILPFNGGAMGMWSGGINNIRDYYVEDNVAYYCGFMLGSGLGTNDDNNHVNRNYTYSNYAAGNLVPWPGIQSGNADNVAGDGEGLVECTGNYAINNANGGGSPFYIKFGREYNVVGNTFVGNNPFGTCVGYFVPTGAIKAGSTVNNNTYHYTGAAGQFASNSVLGLRTFAQWQADTGYDAASTLAFTLPTTNVTKVVGNDYEGRGFVAIYNWEALAAVSVDLSAIGFADGAHCRVRNALNYDEYYDFVYHSSSPSHSFSMAAASWSLRQPAGWDITSVTWPTEPFPAYGLFLVEEIETVSGVALFDITLELSKVLQYTVEAVATGGSSTTLVDSRRREAQDYFRSGTLWFKAMKTSIEVDDWIPGTFTHGANILSVAKDLYAAAGQDYPRWLLVQKINEALQEMLLASENVSLTTAAYQERYPLPDGVYNLKRVEVAEESTDPFGYTPNLNWQEVGGELVFDAWHAPVENDLTIRITYQPRHTQLTEDADVISDRIPIMHLVWRAAALALRWRQGRIRMDDPEQLRQYNDAIVNAERKAGLWPVPTTPRDPHLATW